MPRYLFRGSYTSDTWSRLIKAPEDRAESVRPILASVGARLEALYFAFGDDDVFAIVEAPDNVTAAAISVAITASGAFKSFATSVLMTSDEAIEVMKKASAVNYQPPAAADWLLQRAANTTAF